MVITGHSIRSGGKLPPLTSARSRIEVVTANPVAAYKPIRHTPSPTGVTDPDHISSNLGFVFSLSRGSEIDVHVVLTVLHYGI